MRRAFKIQLSPAPEQAGFINRLFSAVRFAWNKAPAIKGYRYKVRADKLSAEHDPKLLLAVANGSGTYSWLSGFDLMAVQRACINFFQGRVPFSRFKREHSARSISR